MKIIIHGLGKKTSFFTSKPHEGSVVFHANNRYAPCRGCFHCWLQNAFFAL